MSRKEILSSEIEKLLYQNFEKVKLGKNKFSIHYNNLPENTVTSSDTYEDISLFQNILKNEYKKYTFGNLELRLVCV